MALTKAEVKKSKTKHLLTGPHKLPSSFESFGSIDFLNAGDSMNQRSLFELPKAYWRLEKNRKGVVVPVPIIDSNTILKSKKLNGKFKPIICPICYGPIFEATTAMCGHVYCKDCITDTIKKFDTKCPCCRGSVGKLIRIYAIDNQMEKYFEQTFTPEAKLRYEIKRKERVAKLIAKMELDKKSFSRKRKQCFETIAFYYDKYGIMGNLNRCIRWIWSNLVSPLCNIKSVVVGLLASNLWLMWIGTDWQRLLILIHRVTGELIKEDTPQFNALKETKNANSYFNWIWK